MDNIALLNLEGMGMAGHPGVAARLFGALQRVGISVILISQVYTRGIQQQEAPRKNLTMRIDESLVPIVVFVCFFSYYGTTIHLYP